MNNKYCNNCAIRLFNTKHYNLQGVGNPFMGKCIVVPNVDYNAYRGGNMSFSKQVDIITDTLSPTGDVLANLYIIPLIRCNEYITLGIDDASYIKCLNYFKDDIKLYDFKDILLLGSAGKRFFNCDTRQFFNTILISSNKRRYATNYSPFVKISNNDYFKIFEGNLIKWYNSVLTQDFSTYKIQLL